MHPITVGTGKVISITCPFTINRAASAARRAGACRIGLGLARALARGGGDRRFLRQAERLAQARVGRPAVLGAPKAADRCFDGAHGEGSLWLCRAIGSTGPWSLLAPPN